MTESLKALLKKTQMSAPPSAGGAADQMVGSVLVGKYRVVQMLGAGAMARVYKAVDVFLDRPVAIKVLATMAPGMMARFGQEVRVHAKLQHLNIVQALDCLSDEASGITYFAMEYLEGASLQDLIKESGGIQNADDAFYLLKQISSALDYAHRQGVIHRDLKPSNIMVVEQHDEIQAKVVDFGIAKLQDELQKLTKTGQVVGSPVYMSPEQCTGMKLDARSDVYSLGLIAYELFTGKMAYFENNPVAVMRAHCDPDRRPPPIYSMETNIPCPVKLNRIINIALETEAEDRYPTVKDFEYAIAQWHKAVVNGIPDENPPLPEEEEEGKKNADHIEAESEAKSKDVQASRSPWQVPELLGTDDRGGWSRIPSEELEKLSSIETGTGSVISRYQVLDVIGEGGMSVVYRAMDMHTDQIVAAKTLKFVEPTVAQRFMREIKIHMDMRHVNIVKALDRFQTPDGQAFFIMELLEGRTLHNYLSYVARIEEVADICTILAQICDALEFAHDMGIIHRDLKPDNVMLIDQGGALRVKVLDFGLARIQDDLQRLTASGVLLGSPAFMSPEHCLGKPLDFRSDLYSLGIMAFEMITGELPYEGEQDLSLIEAHCNPDVLPFRISDFRRDLPALDLLDQIFIRLLKKNPDERQASVTELKEALGAWWSAIGQPPDAVSPFRVVRRRRKRVQEESVSTAPKAQERAAGKEDLSKDLNSLVSQYRQDKIESFAEARKPSELPQRSQSNVALLGAVLVVIVLGGLFFAFTTLSSNMKKPDAATTEVQSNVKPAEQIGNGPHDATTLEKTDPDFHDKVEGKSEKPPGKRILGRVR